jgi:succinate dehydrogenase / fumarate reductase cytochrome b subunit
MATRPLSPHLSIWKWGPAMLTSILHRVTGDGMAFVGLPILAWWLASLAGGPESYATFYEHASSWYGIIILVGVSWAFFNHLASGIRHLVMDIGAGYELDTNKVGSIASIVAGVLLTAAFWAALILV